MREPIFTLEQAKVLRDNYECGVSTADLARRFKCTRETVVSAIKKAGGTPLPSGGNKPIAVIKDWNDGYSVREIAERYGYTNTKSVYSIIARARRHGIYAKHRPRGGSKMSREKARMLEECARELLDGS
jgi:transposase